MRALAATLMLATALAGCATKQHQITASTNAVAGSGVRIEVSVNGQQGLGSGVYVGDGIVVTAAHVVGDAKRVTCRADDGKSQYCDVLWVDQDYDIAVVIPHVPDYFRAARLDCRTPKVGETVTAWGNPMGVEFITMHGYVSGDQRAAEPNWKSVIVTDMTTIGGMSGGGTFDADGEVIAITVGVMSMGKAADGGLGFAVPAADVCKLLGRK